MSRLNTRLQVGATFALLVVVIACGSPPDTAKEVRRVAKQELGLTEADICSDGQSAMQAKLESFVAQNCASEGATDRTPYGTMMYTVNACMGVVQVPKVGMRPIGDLSQPAVASLINCTTFKRVDDSTGPIIQRPEKSKISQSYHFVARGRASSAADGKAEIWAQSTQQCTKNMQSCQSKPKPQGVGKDPDIVFLSNRWSVSGSATGMTVYDYKVTGFSVTVLKDNLTLKCNASYPRGGGSKVTGNWVQLDALACKGQ